MFANLRSWLFAALLVGLTCISLLAQNATQPSPPPPQNGPGSTPPAGQRRTLESAGEIRWFTQQLNLTPEQRDKLRPILTDEGDQLSAVRLDEHLPMDQKRAKFQEIREAFRPKIEAILTPEQKEKWAKMRELAQQRREERMKNADPDAAPNASASPK